MPPKFTVPSYNLFLVSGLLHALIGGVGLILTKTTLIPSLSPRDFMLPGLPEGPVGDYALGQIFAGMLFFVGLPGLLLFRASPNDRKAVLPVAISMAIYHLYSLLMLFSSFLNEQVPTMGPAQAALPVFIGNLLNELAKTYRIRLWIANTLTHFILYVWHVIWIVRVTETGGIPGHKLSNAKAKKE
ncbi:hypothetical protein BCR33DRAFT_722082 [Rhizoclosmatium globosum]|uniref:Uncharacterized protein n=1 Tax=Rhizoclosmatium globosum TaxID=329046 RepID=A0A1Y2BNW8_9FUNG|nr:hypothetical protein HDU99_008997 [Rhizoclosmatium hyalinum]KAJ3294940.1 hypothetical protein HDU79_010137 [Rhizoclosmatium sp. JEL0117]ORY36277.1 hypothetical protein BCR33DRAFT_722082 [Rhizoclosmatium globosum]|eukprot:ORY36277.1 hypothetical protein BCR33DRAFT_722082 [Rhizoclosmatium globosum]